MTYLVEPQRHDVARAEAARLEDLVDLWLANFASPHTRAAYRSEVDAFLAFSRQPLAWFLALTDSQAHTLVDAYRAAKMQAGLSPSTINRSMAALNSLVRSARRHGATALRLEARGVKSAKYRDTRGPGTDGVQRLIAAARAQRHTWKAARDVALLRTLFALGLRRAEITECDLSDLDTGSATLSIKGKGETERRMLSVPPAAMSALLGWIVLRGTADGPLFLGVDSRGRMTGNGVYYLIRDLGRRAGITARPHGIRHAAITAVLDATNGDMRKAQAFGRHASASTTVAYDDNRQDLGGSASRLLDALVE